MMALGISLPGAFANAIIPCEQNNTPILLGPARSGTVSAPSKAERLAPLPEAALSPAQRRVADAMREGPRGRLSGPFVALLRSPELCQRAQLLGEYLRFESIVPQRLRELAILTTARHWRQNYEWLTHAPIAERAGLARGLIDAIAAGASGGSSVPAEAAPDEAIVLRFCRELHETHAVSDAAYAQARELLGEDGIVELCGLCGYYALLAMVLNVARTAPPPDGEAPFAAP
jgi:4-carboxymuconolactone decarboxylase